MSYGYTPKPGTGLSNADRAAIAAVFADRLAGNAVGHAYGVAAGVGDPAVIPQPTGGYLEGMIDALALAFGFQQQDVAGLSPQSTTNTSFTGNYVGPTWTVPNIPISKTYLVHVDLTNFYLDLNGGLNSVAFQLEVDGVAQTQATSALVVGLAANVRVPCLSFRTPVAFTAGASKTMKLMWKVDNSAARVNVDGVCARAFTITG